MHEYFFSDNLGAICSILEDKANENHLAYDFIVNCIEDVKQKCIKIRLKFADVFNICSRYVILIESRSIREL